MQLFEATTMGQFLCPNTWAQQGSGSVLKRHVCFDLGEDWKDRC